MGRAGFIGPFSHAIGAVLLLSDRNALRCPVVEVRLAGILRGLPHGFAVLSAARWVPGSPGLLRPVEPAAPSRVPGVLAVVKTEPCARVETRASVGRADFGAGQLAYAGCALAVSHRADRAEA